MGCICRIIFGFMLFWLSIPFFAQTRLSGFVYQKDSSYPLNKTDITIVELGIKTSTDRAGYYSFEDIPYGIYTIRFDKLDYEIVEHQIELKTKRLKDENQYLIKNPLADVLPQIPFFTKNTTFQFRPTSEQATSQAYSSDNIDQTIARELNQVVFDRKNRTLGKNKNLSFWNHVPVENNYNWQMLQILTLDPTEVRSQQEMGNVRLGYTGGLVDVETTPFNQKKGLVFAYDYSQQSFNNRYQIAYNTGITKKGWGAQFAASTIDGNRLFADQSETKAKAIHGGLQKIWNKQSIDFTYTSTQFDFVPQEISTQEAYQLKSEEYNPLWGIDGNGRARKTGNNENLSTIIQSTYKKQIDWHKNIKINAFYSKNRNNLNNLIFFNTPSPSPNAIRNLPSYLSYTGADDMTVANKVDLWKNDISASQINWTDLMAVNTTNPSYSIVNQSVNTKNQGVNFWYNDTDLMEGKFNFRLGLASKTSQNSSQLEDLLGASTFPSIQNPNNPFSYYNLAKTTDFSLGDRLYDYIMTNQNANFTTTYQKKIDRLAYAIGLDWEIGSLKRTGEIQNYLYPSNSLGKSKTKLYADVISKFNLTYQAKKDLDYAFSSTFSNLSPSENIIFPVAEYSNVFLQELENKKKIALEIQLNKKLKKILLQISPFFDYSTDGSERQMVFYDLQLDNTTPNNKVSHDIITNVERMNLGTELFFEYLINRRFTFNSLLSISRNTYQNNPKLFLYSDQFSSKPNSVKETQTSLKGLSVGGSPQNWLHSNLSFVSKTNWSITLGANFLFSNYATPNFHRYSQEIFNGLDPSLVDENSLDSLRNQSKLSNLLLFNFNLSDKIETKWFRLILNTGINNIFDTRNAVQEFQNPYVRYLDQWQNSIDNQSDLFQNYAANSLFRNYFIQTKIIFL